MADGIWATGDYRARITAVAITDGRCFHCAGALLDFDEDGPSSPAALPLNVDHAVPRAAGGRDRVTNYVAACESCNKSRQDTPLSPEAARRAAGLWADLDIRHVTVHSRQVDEYLGQAVLRCASCALHLWHVEGSPAHLSCVESVLRDVEPELRSMFPDRGRTWAGVFGVRSREVLVRTVESALWASPAERQAVLVQLPRVLCRNLQRIDDVLTNARDYRDLRDDAAERCPDVFSGLLALAPTTATRRALARVTADAREAALDYQAFTGVRWRAIFRLFLSRNWPTHLLYDHRNRVIALTARQRRHMLSELERIGTVAELFSYFEPPADSAGQQVADVGGGE